MKIRDFLNETVYNLNKTDDIDKGNIDPEKYYVFIRTVDPTLVGPFNTSSEAHKYMNGEYVTDRVEKIVVSGTEAKRLF
jgi:L-rhamnose isomerase